VRSGKSRVAAVRWRIRRDQVNFTDEESHIMPVSGGGFEQAYNDPIGVEGDSRLIVCQHISQQPNDQQELIPALDRLAQLPEEIGNVKTASAYGVGRRYRASGRSSVVHSI
jgi:hypothetical protein